MMPSVPPSSRTNSAGPPLTTTSSLVSAASTLPVPPHHVADDLLGAHGDRGEQPGADPQCEVHGPLLHLKRIRPQDTAYPPVVTARERDHSPGARGVGGAARSGLDDL